MASKFQQKIKLMIKPIIEAIINIIFIIQKDVGIPSHSPVIKPIVPKYPTITKIGTKITLKIVSLFAKFILLPLILQY